jgi:hypothetical protein
MKRTSRRPIPIALVALICALYLPKIAWPNASFYLDVLTDPRLQFIGSMGKLACLGAAAFYSFRIVSRFGKDEGARRPWALIGAWLVLWTAGYVALVIEKWMLGGAPPVPSVADALFLAGYVPLFVAQLRFISLYRSSGLPVGSARQHIAIAAVSLTIVLLASYVLLVPIAHADTPLARRAIDIGYPVMDLVAVVPTIVMLRIALAFRPGAVWTVWGALLVGFLFTAVADIAAAYVSPADTAYYTASHFLYLLGYFVVAYGTKLQQELLTV